jgi:pSer/pThr/pTyr-binding forkhead associated (FHA) protein
VTVTRSVVPGEWYGVLGDTVLVLLPPAAKSRVASVWERVDDGAGFDEVLDSLISGGLRELPGFVLVSAEGDDVARDVKVVIRGAGEAVLLTAEGPVTVTGSADSTWVERSATGVTGLRVRVGEETQRGDATAYTLGSGLVRVAVVEQPSVAAEVSPEQPVASAPEPLAEAVPAPAAVAPEPEPEPEPPAASIPPVAPVPGAPVPAPIPVPPPVGGPAVEPPQPEPAPEDGDTETGALAPTHRAGPEDVVAPPSSRPVARLLFSSGEVVEVDRAIVIGRSPEARRHGDDQARLVSVPSPHQEISSTHLEIRPGSGADHGSAVATDLGSTNGTVVVQPGLPAEDLQPGIAVALVPGAIVDLGEGVTIQVTGL